MFKNPVLDYLAIFAFKDKNIFFRLGLIIVLWPHMPHIGLIFSISPTVGGCGLGGLRSSPPSQGQVHRGAAEVDLDLTQNRNRLSRAIEP